MEEDLPSTSCSKYVTSEGFTIEKYEHDLAQDGTEKTTFDEDKKKPSVPSKRTRQSKLPLHLKGLMGEANLRYARREYDLAKKMCFEIIRQAPDAYEPYETLAHMYENKNTKKYKGFLILACHLEPSNPDLWCLLAEAELQENNLSDAIQSYSRAIQANPKDEELHLKRIELVTKQDDNKVALQKCQLLLASYISTSKHDKIMHLAKDLAEQYFHDKKYSLAIKALNVPIKRIPDKVTPDIINMMLDLLLLTERYSDVLDILTMFCGFTFDVTVEETSFIVNSFTMPESLHLDLKVKFIVCLIRLHHYDLSSIILDQILAQENVEEVGGVFLDIVEALMAANYHEEALKFTVPLVKSKNFSLAAMWLKHAECLQQCKLFDQAVDAYYTVMTLAPNHVEVLYPLAMLLLKLNKKEEALEVLSQDLTKNKLDVAVLIEKMRMLKEIKDYQSYWSCCELLLSRHCVVFKNFEELKVACSLRTVREKIIKIKEIRKFRSQNDDTVESNLESLQEPSPEDEYKFLRQIFQLALDLEEYGQYQKFTFMALTSKRFTNFFSELYLTAAHACIFNRDYYHGRMLIREIFLRHPDRKIAWNYFSQNIQFKDEYKYFRFFQVVKNKIPENLKEYVQANWCITYNNYVDCMSYFVKEYKLFQSPYSAFMIGMCFLQIHCQSKRNVQRRNIKNSAETAIAFFTNYAKKRTKVAEQEIMYNLGRLYHQMGIMHIAEHFYRQVLDMRNEITQEHPHILDLRYEAAYNLSLIYKNSGNLIAARNIIMQNIII